MGHMIRRKVLIFFLNYQHNFTISKPKFFSMGPIQSIRSSCRSKQTQFHSLFKVDG